MEEDPKSTFVGTIKEDAKLVSEKARKVVDTVKDTAQSMWGEGKRSAKENFGEAAQRTGPQAVKETLSDLASDAKEQFGEAAKKNEVVPNLEAMTEAKEAFKQDARSLAKNTAEYAESIQEKNDKDRIVPQPDSGSSYGRF